MEIETDARSEDNFPRRLEGRTNPKNAINLAEERTRRARIPSDESKSTIARFRKDGEGKPTSRKSRRQKLIEKTSGRLPVPFLQWFEDDLASTASAVEELRKKVDRYRAFLAQQAIGSVGSPIGREAQLADILHRAVTLIGAARDVLRHDLPEAVFKWQGGHESAPEFPKRRGSRGCTGREIPPLDRRNGRADARLLQWIENDIVMTSGLLAELLWALFPIHELLDEAGTFDGEGEPRDREAQLAGFVACAIDFLEDAYELLNGRRPMSMDEKRIEALD